MHFVSGTRPETRAGAMQEAKARGVVPIFLSDQEILSAYGARDMWQVIDQVAAELGGATNSACYRTLGTSGATIVGWLKTGEERGRCVDLPICSVCDT